MVTGGGYWGSAQAAADRLWEEAGRQVAAGERCGKCGYLVDTTAGTTTCPCSEPTMEETE